MINAFAVGVIFSAFDPQGALIPSSVGFSIVVVSVLFSIFLLRLIRGLDILSSLCLKRNLFSDLSLLFSVFLR